MTSYTPVMSHGHNEARILRGHPLVHIRGLIPGNEAELLNYIQSVERGEPGSQQAALTEFLSGLEEAAMANRVCPRDISMSGTQACFVQMQGTDFHQSRKETPTPQVNAAW